MTRTYTTDCPECGHPAHLPEPCPAPSIASEGGCDCEAEPTEEDVLAAIAAARAETEADGTALTPDEARALVALWAEGSLPTGLVVMQFGYADVDDWVGLQDVDDVDDDQPLCLATEAPGAPDPAAFLTEFLQDAEVERLVDDGYSVGEAENIMAHDDGAHDEESDPGCPRCDDLYDEEEEEALTPAWRQHLQSRHDHVPGVEPKSPRLPCAICDTTPEETTMQTIDLTPGNEEQANILTMLTRSFASQGMVPNAFGAMASVLDLARCLQANDPERLLAVIADLQRMDAQFGPDTPAGKAAAARADNDW